MSYKITITKTDTVVKPGHKEYTGIGQKEVEREVQFYRGKEQEPKTRIESVYGWTDPIDRPEQVTRDVLIQELDNLDLPAVIRAINGLG